MIEFIVNNKHILTTENSGIPLVDFIRDNQHLKGTKIGCREGDCGACTVLVGSLQKDNSITYQSITSCISPLGNAQGKHIVTIEGTNLEQLLTTPQRALVDNNATQCGFCTPGFVVSLTGLALKDRYISKEEGLNSISGNICRCTGYKSIEKATYQLVEKLNEKDKKNALQWLIDNNYIPKYFDKIPKRLSQIKSNVSIKKSENLVAGGTDIYVRHADTLTEENVDLLLVNRELSGISFYKNSCVIGANTTVSELMYNNAFEVYFPEIKKILKLVSSEQIRNMATLAGNFVNASPIGDITILFLALNSSITIENKIGKFRTIALKDFFQSYKKFDLQEGDIVVNITFNVPDTTQQFNFEKVSKRTHLDIASVNSALLIKTDKLLIKDAHLSIGGVAEIPKYLSKTSKFLIEKEITIEMLKKANLILQEEISPIGDVRGSIAYKRLLARQLLFAHFTKLFPEKISLTKLISV